MFFKTLCSKLPNNKDIDNNCLEHRKVWMLYWHNKNKKLPHCLFRGDTVVHYTLHITHCREHPELVCCMYKRLCSMYTFAVGYSHHKASAALLYFVDVDICFLCQPFKYNVGCKMSNVKQQSQTIYSAFWRCDCAVFMCQHNLKNKTKQVWLVTENVPTPDKATL